LANDEPVHGKDGRGCQHGDGGAGGHGAIAPPGPGRIVSNGGRGGRGFAGESRIVEFTDLSMGDVFETEIGVGGGGGGGGKGFANGGDAGKGAGGSLLFVPVLPGRGGA